MEKEEILEKIIKLQSDLVKAVEIIKNLQSELNGYRDKHRPEVESFLKELKNG